VADAIVVATTEAEYRAFGELIREYWDWLRDRYAAEVTLMDDIAGHQGLDAELESLDTLYGPPSGRTLLAMRGDEVVGGVAYKDLHDGSCEMKRMYVPPRFHGQGTGRLLCEALVAQATADGYTMMRLDTGFRNTEAMAMYEALGFTFCGPYQDYPPALVPHLRFMQRDLRPAG
jgi:GNAT superfamily N-acetyltransferase